MRAEFDPALPVAESSGKKRANAESCFAEMLERFQKQTQADMIRRRQEAAEKAAEEAEERKQKRINELLSLIAHLKSRLAICGGTDASLQAQLGELESELMALLLFG